MPHGSHDVSVQPANLHMKNLCVAHHVDIKAGLEKQEMGSVGVCVERTGVQGHSRLGIGTDSINCKL